MGHVRLGQPPATKKWREIVAYLEAGDVSIPALADAVAEATDKSLMKAAKDPAFIEALWLLIKIPQAAKSKNFAQALKDLGITVPDSPSITDLAVGFDAAIETAQRRNSPNTTDLSEMAKHAGIAALDSLARESTPSLWKSDREDERTTVATFSAPEKFAELSQRFFTNLVEHNIQYFLDREIPRHVRPGNFVQSVGDMASFDGAVKRHCAETTIIMRAFAKDWLGKNAHNLKKDISRKDVAGFAHVAFKKIRKELSIRSAANEHV